jgi:hypothetical protein
MGRNISVLGLCTVTYQKKVIARRTNTTAFNRSGSQCAMHSNRPRQLPFGVMHDLKLSSPLPLGHSQKLACSALIMQTASVWNIFTDTTLIIWARTQSRSLYRCESDHWLITSGLFRMEQAISLSHVRRWDLDCIPIQSVEDEIIQLHWMQQRRQSWQQS